MLNVFSMFFLSVDALPKILDVPHPVRASVKNEEIKDSDKEGGTNDSETDEPKTYATPK